MAAIRAGEAVEGQQAPGESMDGFPHFRINGRVWVLEDSGAIVPIRGPGLIPMTRREYQGIIEVIERGGDARPGTPLRRYFDGVGCTEAEIELLFAVWDELGRPSRAGR